MYQILIQESWFISSSAYLMQTICIWCLQAKSDEQLWSERARRKVLQAILSEWVKVNKKKTTVKKLMTALSFPGWFDVKLRVEKMLEMNISDS